LTSPSAETDLVTLRNVKFSYGNRQILRGIDLAVPRGKVVAIMGGSGCGKTTILRLIGGQLRAIRARSASRRDMSQLESSEAVQDAAAEWDAVSVWCVVHRHERLRQRRVPVARAHALPDDIIHDLVTMKLEAVGLRGAAEMLPAELSGGMARRVALARAIALDPMLIMYDEPFAGLDPIALAIIGDLIRKLNDALGATSIVVTHDIVEIAEDRRLRLLRLGRPVIAQGTPAEVRARPRRSMRPVRRRRSRWVRFRSTIQAADYRRELAGRPRMAEIEKSAPRRRQLRRHDLASRLREPFRGDGVARFVDGVQAFFACDAASCIRRRPVTRHRRRVGEVRRGWCWRCRGSRRCKNFGADEAVGRAGRHVAGEGLGPVVAGLLFSEPCQDPADYSRDRSDEDDRAVVGDGDDGRQSDCARRGAKVLGRRDLDAVARRDLQRDGEFSAGGSSR
jgi:phospholipid/cholesterol/gamma-HCH transport system ATP-binding protein